MQIMAAMMPLASHAPRPQRNSSSSREGKKGGTVSMCVDSVTTGLPQLAKTLKRCASTCMRSTSPPYFAASGERWRNRNSPAPASLFVTDSISTSARVSSKRSIVVFRNGTREGKNRRKTRGCHSSIALHPHNFTTDDSGQVLGLAPSRSAFSCRSDFGGSTALAPFALASEADRKSTPRY